MLMKYERDFTINQINKYKHITRHTILIIIHQKSINNTLTNVRGFYPVYLQYLARHPRLRQQKMPDTELTTMQRRKHIIFGQRRELLFPRVQSS